MPDEQRAGSSEINALDQREHHLNQVLRAIRNVNQLIVRETRPQSLVQRSCQLLVETRGYGGAWIALAHDDQPAWHFASAGFEDGIQHFEQQLRQGQWPICCGARNTESERLAILDPTTDCTSCPIQNRYHGGKAAVIKLHSADRSVGYLGVALPPGFAVDDDERALLLEVAGDLAFALCAMENESKRHEANERLVLGFERSAVGQTLTSLDGHYLRVNDAFASMLGYAASELTGFSVDALTHPDERGLFAQQLARIPDGQETLRFEKRFLARDGRTVRVDANIALLRDQEGRPQFYVCSYIDISGREFTENALRESEQRYRTLVENLDDMVFSVDAGGRFTYVSNAVKRYGYTVDEVVGHDISEFVVPEDVSGLRTSLARTLAGQFEPFEFMALGKTGKIFSVRSSSHPVESNGAVVGVSGVLIDLTAQRQAEQQARMAQKMEAIGLLAGGIAHDFNNVLSVILTNISFALDSIGGDSPLRESLQEIEVAGQRAGELTRQLLAFSRKQLQQLEVLDCNAVIANMQKMLRRLIGEDVVLAVRTAPDLWPAKVDRGQLEQVIMNLAVNARDAMLAGGRLVIETANVEVDPTFVERHPGAVLGPHVRITVEDSGCGMDQTTLTRVFEPFFTTKPVGKGTGLGLATVYGVVKQSGGSVWVDSQIGRGTIITIHLPRATESLTAELPAPAPTPTPAASGVTVLVVEDEEAVRNVTRRILAAAGYEVVVAADGAAALQICARPGQRVDLVLTDVVMPGMSGRELVDRLAQSVPHIKSLYMSGYTDDAIAHQGVLDPGTQFIAKPFTREALVQRVRAVLDGHDDGRATTLARSVVRLPPPAENNSRQELSSLSPALCRELKQAAAAARCDDLRDQINAMSRERPALAIELERRADNFDYEGILQLLEGEQP